jgi:methionyl-tRNA synthetase
MLTIAAGQSWAQQPPTDAQVATVLVGEVQALVTDLATQRDAIGGWPATVSTAYDRLRQLESQLETARAAGDARAFRRAYRAAMRVASRISRWLANQYDAANEEVPSRERADAIAARLSTRVSALSQIASQAGVTLDLSAVDAAWMQFESVRANGTNAQLRMALRAWRDAIDDLQAAVPDPEG